MGSEMCIRDRRESFSLLSDLPLQEKSIEIIDALCTNPAMESVWRCLLYTSDAADERSSVDLGGRRIIKKKKKDKSKWLESTTTHIYKLHQHGYAHKK